MGYCVVVLIDNGNLFISGQKSTKHKDSDGDTSPSPRKSPKRSPTKPSGRERTPPRKEQGITDKGGGYAEETPIEPATKSVSYSTPSSKSYGEPVGKENVYSGKSESKSRTPSKMSGKDPVEPLTPILVNTELTNHHVNTSTPAQNGVISSGQSPPMSK